LYPTDVRFRIGALLLTVAAAVLGQTNLQKGKSAIDATLAALGGDRYLAVENRVESGRAYSFYQEQLSGLSRATIYTRYKKPGGAAPPGTLLLSERQAFGKNGRDGAVLFMAGEGYSVTFRGARLLAPDRQDRYRETTLHNVFYILRARLNEPGMIFEYQGTDIVGNRPVIIVNITDSDNRTTSVYLDRTTNLPARQVWYRRDPKTRDRQEEVTIFSKYREVDGVQWPLDVERLRDGEKVFQIYCESLAFNQKLDDGLFTLPPGVNLLKPER
jgi:hypothetical protein